MVSETWSAGRSWLGHGVYRAWVCAQCSASFPMALAKRTFFGTWEPLYAEGKRIEDRPP
jgi:hypothetical protein